MNRGKSWLTGMLITSLLVGILSGSLAGGLMGFFVARSQPVSAASDGSAAQRVSLTASTASRDLTVQAVQHVAPAVVTVVNTLDERAEPNPFQQMPFPFPAPKNHRHLRRSAVG